jgi:hypothetical protein
MIKAHPVEKGVNGRGQFEENIYGGFLNRLT